MSLPRRSKLCLRGREAGGFRSFDHGPPLRSGVRTADWKEPRPELVEKRRTEEARAWKTQYLEETVQRVSGKWRSQRGKSCLRLGALQDLGKIVKTCVGELGAFEKSCATWEPPKRAEVHSRAEGQPVYTHPNRPELRQSFSRSLPAQQTVCFLWLCSASIAWRW